MGKFWPNKPHENHRRDKQALCILVIQTNNLAITPKPSIGNIQGYKKRIKRNFTQGKYTRYILAIPAIEPEAYNICRFNQQLQQPPAPTQKHSPNFTVPILSSTLSPKTTKAHVAKQMPNHYKRYR